MIARFGLAGSQHHIYKRVRTRAEGEAWLDSLITDASSESERNARRQSCVLTDREAWTCRWQDGRRIYTRHDEFGREVLIPFEDGDPEICVHGVHADDRCTSCEAAHAEAR